MMKQATVAASHADNVEILGVKYAALALRVASFAITALFITVVGAALLDISGATNQSLAGLATYRASVTYPAAILTVLYCIIFMIHAFFFVKNEDHPPR